MHTSFTYKHSSRYWDKQKKNHISRSDLKKRQTSAVKVKRNIAKDDEGLLKPLP